MRFALSVVAMLALSAMVPSAQDTTGHVTMPKIIKEVRPSYTPEGRAARIEGTVVVQAVVLPDGTVGDVKIARSLDTKYGLDTQALNAAKQWKFSPATKDGKPVAVTVSIELTFFLNSQK